MVVDLTNKPVYVISYVVLSQENVTVTSKVKAIFFV